MEKACGFWTLVLHLALVALVSAAPGPSEVTFFCDPSDAQIYLEREGYGRKHLGQSHQPLFLSSEDLSGTFWIVREGWEDQPVEAKAVVSPDGVRYPREGVLSLTPLEDPASRSLQRIYRFRQRAPLLLGALTLVTLAGGLIFSRTRKTTTSVEEPDYGDDPWSGRTLGPYRLGELLGVGGMARVYRAIPLDGANVKCHQEAKKGGGVAVKVLHRSQLTAEDQKRFRREVKICQNLEHPSLVGILDHGEEDGQPYFVMELLSGETLRERMSSGPIPISDLLELVLPIMQGLEYAHKSGVVHRDLKPENVILTSGGAKLADFGVARGEGYTLATATGFAIGTPEYMAPEQADGELEPAADQYALGILMYEILCGRLPFQESDPVRLIMKQVSEPPPPLNLEPQFQELEAVIMRMLSKDPEDRYSNLEEVARALQRALS